VGEPVVWRNIDELARLVGRYCWTEHRIFELAGAWATAPAADAADAAHTVGAEVRVWCAAVSRRHGDLARSWAERLPVRAGLDPAAFVVPSAELESAFDALGAVSDPVCGAGVLAGPVLAGLDAVYAAHLETASAVSEGPVAEVLVAARLTLAADRASGHALLRGMQAAGEDGPSLRDGFERAFEEIGIFPAVRPS
jgi:hypothetical protein